MRKLTDRQQIILLLTLVTIIGLGWLLVVLVFYP